MVPEARLELARPTLKQRGIPLRSNFTDFRHKKSPDISRGLFIMVPEARLELARPTLKQRGIPLRSNFSDFRHKKAPTLVEAYL